MLRIHFRNGSRIPTWLNKPRMVMGSSPQADITLPAGMPAEVAVFETSGETTTVRPTGTLPVQCNGQPVGNAGSPLQAGDKLVIGDIEFDIADPMATVQAMKGSVEKMTGKPLATKSRNTGGNSPWKLVGKGGLLGGKEFPLHGTMVMGRDTEADIVIAGTHLSRRHAQLTVTPGAVQVKDLDSSNGTFINDKRVTEGFLKNGDELRIDTFVFRAVGPADDRDKTVVASAIDIPNPIRNPDEIKWKTKPTSKGNNYRTGVTDSVQATPGGNTALPWIIGVAVIAAIAGAAFFLM